MTELFRCGSKYHVGERMLPRDAFYANKKKANGIQAICKDCERAYQRAQRDKKPNHPELGGELLQYVNSLWKTTG
jgi:hypothetical protein